MKRSWAKVALVTALAVSIGSNNEINNDTQENSFSCKRDWTTNLLTDKQNLKLAFYSSLLIESYNQVIPEEFTGKAPEALLKIMPIRVSRSSGFIIDNKNGYIVTNHHVVDKEVGVFNISFYNPSQPQSLGPKITASVIGSDKESDIAVLKLNIPEEVDTSNLPCISPSNDPISASDDVYAMVNSKGPFSVVKGIVANENRKETENITSIQTNLHIRPGASGSALLNEKGEWVGVNKIYFVGTEFGLATSSKDAVTAINNIIEDHKRQKTETLFAGPT